MRIVQFTDTHLLGRQEELYGVDTYAALKQLLALALTLEPKPDVFLISGDIADDGSRAAYLRLRELFECTTVPVFLVPGNHDDLHALCSVAEGNLNVVDFTALGHWACIFINSQVTGKSYGEITDAALATLLTCLDRAGDAPVLVVLHHPPLSPCPISSCRLQNEEVLLKVIQRYRNVKAVLAGHLHQEITATFEGIQLLTTPSTFAQGIHPDKDTVVESDDFWASHKLDFSRQGFRVLDLFASGEFKTFTYNVIRA